MTLSKRVQVLLDDHDRQSFQQMAERQGLSLSAWLRSAGRERLARQSERGRIDSVVELDAFFEQCNRRETGIEPEWQDHRKVIEGSLERGRANS